MTKYVQKFGLKVDVKLNEFLINSILPGLKITEEIFWKHFANTVKILGPKNRKLLEIRQDFQNQIDSWHIKNRNLDYNLEKFKEFLKEINYIKPEGGEFMVDTENVDPEIASIAGPQLVVPVTNARYALNAVNARWGSLYDALYGTDMIDEKNEKIGYSRERGSKVVALSKKYLDEIFSLKSLKWENVKDIESVRLSLIKSEQYVGRNNSGILLKNNNLHVKILINKKDPIGALDPAGISDVLLESAISVIMDCEDSVATVDVDDKILAYSNWLGLMKGNLTEVIQKNGKEILREINNDETYETNSGISSLIKNRSLMLVRNVGHLMTTSAILGVDNQEVGEGIMDAYFSILCALHDVKLKNKNSIFGSIYIVKPKMHGPDEVKLADEIFSQVEDAFGLSRNTVKIGIMDEERRTTLNLKECIRVAKSRIAFINTGFLDRTGDEIHTSMELGPFLPKSQIKLEPWIEAYENLNVDIGLLCGLRGKAQIGKGMWAAPDQMKKMFEEKINHPKSGANCAWVPSPTAATLHALHYHKINVTKRQIELENNGIRNSSNDLLKTPISDRNNWSEEEIISEIENNAQGILGYVVRWIDQGVGCSKVPDINNVGLMEDRATCRISSQHIANWIHHGVVTEEKILQVMKKMATVVDKQNEKDKTYEAMGPSFSGVAFNAACELVFEGRKQPSGYTEPILHLNRIKQKNKKMN
ncbi:malate synthase G [Rhodobacteraceae bacterium]|nr:malate synthase G [Paracoccaceae bacterium]MDC1255639.1 malate synthase G [Paracoccaceae bacterium]